MKQLKKFPIYGFKLIIADDIYNTLKGANALILMTDWKILLNPDYMKIMVLNIEGLVDEK